MGVRVIVKNKFNYDEYNKIKSKYGKESVIKDVSLFYTNKKYINEMKNNIKKDRRGEVAFAVKRPNNRIIIVRTSFYPKGVYRIPTGGINYGENIIEALHREVKEELGLIVKIEKFIGVIRYRINYNTGSFNFYSYSFLLNEIGGNIMTDAIDNEVSEYKEADLNILNETVSKLRSFNDSWKDWCNFRAFSTEFVYNNI